MVPFLYSVAADLYRRYGADLRHVAVVFNNKRPVIFLKKYLAEISGQPLWSPASFTIQGFFAQSGNTAVADNLPRFFLLYEAYNELLGQEGKEPLDKESFLGLAEIILRDFDQIDYELADPRTLFRYLQDTAEIEQQFSGFTSEQQEFLRRFWSTFSVEKQFAVQQKFIELWKRLPLLYGLFKEKMKAAGLTGMAQLYRDLAEDKAGIPDFMDRYIQVAFVGFNALNKCEATLFRKWQDAGKALFYFDGDAYYFDDPVQEAGFFLRKNIKEYRLKNVSGPFPEQIKNQVTEIAVYPVTGNITQAKTLVEIFRKDSFESGENPIRRALILADEGLLIPVLQTIPDKINLNITMGFPLRQSPIYGFIDTWLRLQEQLSGNPKQNVRKEDALSLLAHPLCGIKNARLQKILRVVNDFPGPEIPVATLGLEGENYDLFRENKDGLQCIEALNNMLSDILARKEESGSLHLIESALLVAVNQALNQLYDGLSAYPDELSIVLTIAFIRKALSAVATPLEGEPLLGLQVMGLLESRCLDFEEVIILGANEGTLPQLSLSPTLIPDALRRAYGLPVLENQDALSAYLFYRLLQRASKVSIVYNSVTDNNSSGELSRFVQQIKFESGLDIKTFPQRQRVNLLPSAISPLVMEKSKEVMNSLKRYLGPAPPEAGLSASALKLYLQCPLQFFFKYIARIKEPDLKGDILDPVNIGRVLHKVMEQFYAEWIGREVKPEDIRTKMKSLPERCVGAMSEHLFGERNRLQTEGISSSRKIALHIIEENVRLILNHDAQVAPFKIIELENSKDYHIGFPIEIGGKTETVNLRAIIDRVDEVGGRRRIVDYKTGGDQLDFNNIEELFSSEKPGNMAAFQALFYIMIYQKVKDTSGVVPHLYILRKLNEEGSALGFVKNNTLNPYPEPEIESMMPEFEALLKSKLEALFDPAIPFRHNEKGKHYDSNPYALFCNTGEAE